MLPAIKFSGDASVAPDLQRKLSRATGERYARKIVTDAHAAIKAQQPKIDALAKLARSVKLTYDFDARKSLHIKVDMIDKRGRRHLKEFGVLWRDVWDISQTLLLRAIGWADKQARKAQTR